MLGLANYLSDDDDDDDDTPAPKPTPQQPPESKDKGKKRVINVSLPLAFARDAGDDDGEEVRPMKKANAGSSLANLLPAPKNASLPSSDKKQTKPPPSTAKQASSTSTPTLKTPSTTTVPTRTNISRTANPLLHLHRTAATSSTPTETTDDTTSSDEPFFPIAHPSHPLHHPSTGTPAQESSEPYQYPSSHQVHTQHLYAPATEASAPYHPQANPYPQQQEYNTPYYPEQQQHQQQHYSQQHQQPQQYGAYYDPDATPEGITAPYQPKGARGKRGAGGEPDFSELGANVIEINQKDMLQRNRPGYSEAGRLAEIRRAKMSIPAPKPSKLQRSRHQLTAMVLDLERYEAQQRELEEQERAIIDRGRF